MERTTGLNYVGESARNCDRENDGCGVRSNQLLGASCACPLC